MHLPVRSLLLFVYVAGLAAAADSAGSFEKNVKPLLATTCAPCHNDRMASGGLNVTAFSAAASVTELREGWERIVQKIRSGEMPPKGIPRPPEIQVTGLIKFVEGEFEKADRSVKPDPGRVTARRLNRTEYSNTIRDLLAVDFRA